MRGAGGADEPDEVSGVVNVVWFALTNLSFVCRLVLSFNLLTSCAGLEGLTNLTR